MSIKKILFSFIYLLCAGFMQADNNNGFAIVVDPVTYDNVRTEIELYAKAIQEKEQLVPIIVIAVSYTHLWDIKKKQVRLMLILLIRSL